MDTARCGLPWDSLVSCGFSDGEKALPTTSLLRFRRTPNPEGVAGVLGESSVGVVGSIGDPGEGVPHACIAVNVLFGAVETDGSDFA